MGLEEQLAVIAKIRDEKVRLLRDRTRSRFAPPRIALTNPGRPRVGAWHQPTHPTHPH